jgi:hypothetical protein
MILILSDATTREVAIDLEAVTSISETQEATGPQLVFFITGDKDLLLVKPASEQIERIYRIFSEKHHEGFEKINVFSWGWQK